MNPARHDSARPPEGGLEAHLMEVMASCLHCGLCLPACPTYELTADERSSPRGRIRLVRSAMDGSLEPGRAFAAEMNFCLGCLSCESACPAGVRYREVVEHGRDLSAARGIDPPGLRFRRAVALRLLFGGRRRFAFFALLLRLYRATGLREAVERSGLLLLAPAALRRLLSALPDVRGVPFHRPPGGTIDARAPRRGSVGLLTGCVMNVAFQEAHRDTADLLRDAGYDVVLPGSGFCCGALHAHNGDPGRAARLARETIAAFPPGLDAVVVNSAGCGAFMKEYGRALAGDAAAARFAARVRDLSEFLDDARGGAAFRTEARVEGAPGGEGAARKVAYQDACHLLHAQRISRPPRSLLETVSGTRLVEMRDAFRCCGSAGIYNLLRPADSDALLDRKVDSIIATGAGEVVTGNPGCHLQISRGLREAGSDVRVVHLATFLRGGSARG